MSEPTDFSPVEAHECNDVKCPYCADTFCAGCDQCLAKALAEVASLRAENGTLREREQRLRIRLQSCAGVFEGLIAGAGLRLALGRSTVELLRARLADIDTALSSGADGGQEGKR